MMFAYFYLCFVITMFATGFTQFAIEKVACIPKEDDRARLAVLISFTLHPVIFWCVLEMLGVTLI